MPRTPTQPVASDIPRWPATTAVLNADGSGRLTIDGRREELPAGDLAASRELVKHRVTDLAQDLGRPVRLTSTDPDGEWELAIAPDGGVRELAAQPGPPAAPSVAAPPVPEPTAAPSAAVSPNGAPAPTPYPPLDVGLEPKVPTVPLTRRARPPAPLSRSQRKWAGTPAPLRRPGRPVALAVALAVLVCLASATALLVTNGGPDTVVSTPDGTPAPAISDRHENVAPAAIAAARRKGEQRRAAAAIADRRAARRALQRRVSARQAHERRAARRALQRRVAARQARERRAAARRAATPPASTPTRPAPRVTPPPRPAAVTPLPPPPPPRPRPRPCGEFDLC
jgi:hypothetical protein